MINIGLRDSHIEMKWYQSSWLNTKKKLCTLVNI